MRASRTFGRNREMVFSATLKENISCLKVAPVAMCLSVTASFRPGSSGFLKT